MASGFSRARSCAGEVKSWVLVCAGMLLTMFRPSLAGHLGEMRRGELGERRIGRVVQHRDLVQPLFCEVFGRVLVEGVHGCGGAEGVVADHHSVGGRLGEDHRNLPRFDHGCDGGRLLALDGTEDHADVLVGQCPGHL